MKPTGEVVDIDEATPAYGEFFQHQGSLQPEPSGSRVRHELVRVASCVIADLDHDSLEYSLAVAFAGVRGEHLKAGAITIALRVWNGDKI